MTFPDTHKSLEMVLFILDQGQAIAEAVLVLWILEHLDANEDVRLCFLPDAVRPALDSLPLQKLKDALSHGVIMAVPALGEPPD